MTRLRRNKTIGEEAREIEGDAEAGEEAVREVATAEARSIRGNQNEAERRH